jgi:hypothetical protein
MEAVITLQKAINGRKLEKLLQKMDKMFMWPASTKDIAKTRA